MPAPSLHVRPLAMTDRVAARELALVNEMFAADEMAGFDEMLSDHLGGRLADHHWVVAVADVPGAGPAVLGAAYWAPEPFADRVWNLYFLAVHPDAHRQGAGSALVDHVVESLTRAGEAAARVLLVETSSTDAYQPARDF